MSATVAAFLSQSYLTSRTTSEDVSAFYLAQIYQLQLEAALNTGNVSVPPQLSPPVVAPVPRISHVLWFSSLASSLSSAVLATLVQGWVRRYLVMTEPRHSAHSRARIRAYISREGSQRLLQLTVEVMSLSLDVSIHSFLAGLVILAHNNGDGLCGLITQVTFIPLTLLYLWSTLASFIRPHTMYSTPLSMVAVSWRLVIWVVLSPLVAIWGSRLGHNFNPFVSSAWWTWDRKVQATERLVEAHNLSLDRDIVAWLLRSLLQETEMERFLASIPGFYGSAHVQDPAQVFRSLHTDALPDAIVSLMHRTLSSDSIPPETRRKRIVLCLEVIQLDLYLLQRTFLRVLSLPTNPTIFQCVDFVLVADRTVESTDRDAQLLAKCIIAVAISHIKDDQSEWPWSHVVRRWLNIQIFDTSYRGRRASVKLINLVRLAQALNSAAHTCRDEISIFDGTLRTVGQIQVEKAADQYRNEFCIVWNQLLDSARAPAGSNANYILPCIRNIYAALHEGTVPDNNLTTWGPYPACYPQCSSQTHHHTPHASHQAGVNVTPNSREATGRRALTRRSSFPCVRVSSRVA